MKKPRTKLRWYRQRENLSQTKLGARVGMSAAEISRIETGALTPYPAYRQRLSDYFGVSESELFGEVGTDG